MSSENAKRFKDRAGAAEILSRRLVGYADYANTLVLALPRGGVPVGFVIATNLRLPLDVLLVRKLGLPGHEEYAMGAIASGGVCILRAEAMSSADLSPAVIEAVAQRELHEIGRRESLYRGNRPALQLREQTVILTDDGLATGATMEVAVKVVRAANPARLIVAVPVGSSEACKILQSQVDEFICLNTPDRFFAVGQWYDNFDQTSDDEVISLLGEAQRQQTLRDRARQPQRNP